jgi:pantothenate kinase type III
MLNLLRKRLAFITNGSRRVFGIIGEPSVCFVCDCKTTDHRRFDEFRSAIKNLLKEQVTKIKRFNIIW